MVERVPWMAPVDYEIMLFFEKYPIQATPKVVAANIDYDRQYVGKRCSALAEADLLEPVNTGLYELSDLGIAFLEGEIDGQNFENPDG